MTEEEWDLIINLASTGQGEVPWAWQSDFPEIVDGDPVDSDKVDAVMAKFRMLVKNEKLHE